MWQSVLRNKLQSLLDTTPPKRVPVLWDGSAPAPSESSPTASSPPEYRFAWMESVLCDFYSQSQSPRRREYALLGFGVLGYRIDCRGVRLHWRCNRLSRHCEDIVHRLLGAVSDFSGYAFGQRACLTSLDGRSNGRPNLVGRYPGGITEAIRDLLFSHCYVRSCAPQEQFFGGSHRRPIER